MASIEKAPNGKGYRVRWRDMSGKQCCRHCPDHDTAKKLRLKVESSIALGQDWNPADPTPTTPTLEVICQSYLDDQVRVLSPRTLEGRHFVLNQFLTWLQDRFGENIDTKRISRQLMADFYAWLTSVRECSALTAGQRVRNIESLWRWACDHDDYEPHMPRYKKLVLAPTQPKLRPIAPTWAQMDAVVESTYGWYHPFFTMLRYTGLRKSQVMRLQWDDVDMEAGTLYIRPELGKSRREKHGRTVPLSPHLLKEMAGWGKRQGWLVPCARANRLPDAEKSKRIWSRAGIIHPDILRQPHHAFRKGLVSGLRAMRADKDAIKYLVGHDLDVMGEVYSDPSFALALRETVAMIPAIGASGVMDLSGLLTAPPISKLTADDVREIRKRVGQESRMALALAYGVSVTTISQIVLRKTWKDLDGEVCTPSVLGLDPSQKAVG